MKSILLIALLSIINMLLFFDQVAGLNIVLFSILFVLFIVYVFKNNDLIKNKKGLLFLIPILLLSCTYFVYDNIFKYFNLFAIPILYLLMFIYTIKPTYNIKNIIDSFTKIIFNPLDRIPYFFQDIKKESSDSINMSKEKKGKIKSFLIVIPIVIIVLILLSTADQIFGNLFIKITDLFKNVELTTLIFRIIWVVIVFIYLGALFNFLVKKYKEEKNTSDEIKIKITDYTAKLLLTILNVIYIVFDFIQIRSLLLKYGLNNINYAEYARSGFFQLVIISIINITIVLMSKKTKETKYNKVMSLIMVFLTLIIIASSFMRMMMYESAYGYTLLRLMVYVALITEVILIVPTILYILDHKINIFKSYMIIIVSVYTLINFISVDYVIANNNINRYYKKDKLDLKYLMNNYTDNVPLLIELENKTNDHKIKKDIKEYLKDLTEKKKISDFREFNISRKKAVDRIEK